MRVVGLPEKGNRRSFLAKREGRGRTGGSPAPQEGGKASAGMSNRVDILFWADKIVFLVSHPNCPALLCWSSKHNSEGLFSGWCSLFSSVLVLCVEEGGGERRDSRGNTLHTV